MAVDILKGTGVALATPMKPDGEVDLDAFERLIEKNIAGGVDYLVVLGTTGEAITLTTAECRVVMDCALAVNKNRVPIVAGHFGGNETMKLLKRIEDYDFTGISAVLSSNPAYNKPSQEGIYQHYMRVAEACPVPVIIYNVPGRTSSNVEVDTVLRLANDHSNFAGIKEASGDLVAATHLIKKAPKDFLILSGDDPTAMMMCALGGHGVISVIANIYPEEFSKLIKYAMVQDLANARVYNNLLLDVHPWLYAEGNPVGVKGALQIQGIMDSRKARFPLVECSERIMEGLRQVMSEVAVGT